MAVTAISFMPLATIGISGRPTGDYLRFLCDTEAELPSAGVQNGDQAFTVDSKKRWTRVANAWQEETAAEVSVSWGTIIGTLSNQTDLQDALDAVGGGGPHATSHQNGQADEISVAGLSGLLADAQTPLSHSHPQSEVTNLVTDLSGKAATSHTHAAADITSGVIAMARLATGTPDGTKFIRDDGTLQTPPGGSSAPTGSGMDWYTDTPPAGWLICDGSSISRATYAALFAVIGTIYGSVDGDSFNLPDRRGRVSVGKDAGQTEFDALGETGGAKTHTLTVTEIPSHGHTQDPHNHTQDAHSHLTQRYPTATGGSSGFTIDTSMSGTLADNTLPTKIATATNQAATATNQNTGGDGAHNNLQPYIVVHKIIKT